MKKHNILQLLLLLTSITFAQNNNNQIDIAGDIAIIGFSASTAFPYNSSYAFVLLDDCPANTSIIFDDDEWTGTEFSSATAEGNSTWTNNTGAIIPKGTVIKVTNANDDAISTVNHGSVTETNNGFNITDGDQIYAYIGTDRNPTTFLTFYGDTADLGMDPNEKSVLTGTGLNASSTAYVTNTMGYYSGATTFNGSLSDFLSTIYNSANWTAGEVDIATNTPELFSGSTFPDTNLSTDINDLNTTIKIKISNKHLTVSGLKSAYKLTIYTIAGKKCFTATSENKTNNTFNLSGISSGIYIAKINTTNTVITKKITLTKN